jgi:hypothetical protein
MEYGLIAVAVAVAVTVHALVPVLVLEHIA